MVKINQSLHRLQVAWREAQQSSSPAADSLREQFERLMTIYLSTKTAMTEPQMLQNCLNLQVSMAVLLVQLAMGNRGTEPLELTFPLPEVENSALAYVPGEAACPAGGPSVRLPQLTVQASSYSRSTALRVVRRLRPDSLGRSWHLGFLFTEMLKGRSAFEKKGSRAREEA